MVRLFYSMIALTVLRNQKQKDAFASNLILPLSTMNLMIMSLVVYCARLKVYTF